jgi:hypothetical protein
MKREEKRGRERKREEERRNESKRGEKRTNENKVHERRSEDAREEGSGRIKWELMILIHKNIHIDHSQPVYPCKNIPQQVLPLCNNLSS